MKAARRHLRTLILVLALPPLVAPHAPSMASAPSATGVWTRAAVDTPIPARLPGAQFVYDSARKKAVMFSSVSLDASGHTVDAADTWVYDGTSWSQVHSADPPQGRAAASMAYDPAERQTVLFGGYDQAGTLGFRDTWTFDGAQWHLQHPAAVPAPRSDAAMAYDPVSRRMILFGGWEVNTPDRAYPDGFDDTWAWDGTTWTRLHPAHMPPSGVEVYAATGDHLMLYAGSQSRQPTRSQTWEWTGSDWQQLQPAVSPPARENTTVAGDGHNVVLFGGYGADPTASVGELSDAWEWTGDNWIPIQTGAAPSGRLEAGLAAAGQGRFTMFGGEDFTSPSLLLDDTWSLALGTVPGAGGSATKTAINSQAQTGNDRRPGSDLAAEPRNTEATSILAALRPAATPMAFTYSAVAKAPGASPSFSGYIAAAGEGPRGRADMSYTMTVPSLTCTEPAALQVVWQMGIARSPAQDAGAAIEQWCEGTHPGYALQIAAEGQWIYRGDPLSPGDRLAVHVTSTSDALTVTVRNLTKKWTVTGVFAPETDAWQTGWFGDAASVPTGEQGVPVPRFTGQSFVGMQMDGSPVGETSPSRYAMVPAYGGPIQVTASPLRSDGFSPSWSAN